MYQPPYLNKNLNTWFKGIVNVRYTSKTVCNFFFFFFFFVNLSNWRTQSNGDFYKNVWPFLCISRVVLCNVSFTKFRNFASWVDKMSQKRAFFFWNCPYHFHATQVSTIPMPHRFILSHFHTGLYLFNPHRSNLTVVYWNNLPVAWIISIFQHFPSYIYNLHHMGLSLHLPTTIKLHTFYLKLTLHHIDLIRLNSVTYVKCIRLK